MSTVDTGKVTDRRQLRFESIDDLLADVDRLLEADKRSKLRRTGNWTAGQAFNHLASWIDFAYEGFPPRSKPPWFIRFIIRMKKKKYIHDAMSAGIKIPGVQDGTFATQPMSTQEGADRLRKALARLKNGEPPRFESPAFGPLSEAERLNLNLRHAELHLSFLHPGP